ncbi:UDP-glucose 4-epimerase GalE [Cellvibrio japonicus]|uniref:UDP-glucose 4-epimerase n=1 Tax=Cellvibrio japonicus (strain Ueda107) TaxID=498211 RepID=B3PKM0_CELJU|nr:UDP-glucose 4-epimerase GalE [Cellvibrio japonicus]ACE84548.1 UDP-glucose 4-epimerase [Cellvibrio japonicus Ueda107]QEI11432.1 UDP-glucose 4-epimerase GalE [Cellvibrio japonicus]QEI15006.1 UDP-glucose 4-epimerase GalE [Cellvibrio japonicus]QEI18586.1 UDP-glucose 4-epimerase GalE [Cellvibrio japonicus]
MSSRLSTSAPRILVTGGAGYIGSHVCVELINSGYLPVVVDNLCNSKAESLKRVARITGVEPVFYAVDINDKAAMGEVFATHQIEAVMHFAGLKAVGESNQIPMKYYRYNVAGTLSLTEVMEAFSVWKLIFSSSATVYGDPVSVPIDESFATSATNPYGRSKLMVEEILHDIARAPNSQWNFTLLRYFNPVGAHESGLIGEDPAGIPNNLLPYVAQVAIGKLRELSVFGNDYPTIDGTGVRDYIHVVDLARGHVAALQGLDKSGTGCRSYNLGTGCGYSVLQMVKAFEDASGRPVPYKVVARRPGDIASCYANADKAKAELGWQAEYGLERMMVDTWRWQSQNPHGYEV